MRAIRGVALCLSIVLTAGLSAQPRSSGDVLPFKATEKTLANGLRVIVVPTGFPNLVSVQIPVQTGSRNEVEPGKSGFAHFFEHVMFRGTPETPPEKYREIMSSAGARDNASTSDDFTRYYSTFAKEDLNTILATYADMFKNLAYSEVGLQDRGSRSARRVQQEQRRAAPKAHRSPARALLPGAHLQAHDDGLYRRHREHARPVRVLEGVFPALVSPAVHDRGRRGRRDAGGSAPHDREALGRLEGRDWRDDRDSPGAAAHRREIRSRAVGERDAAVGERRVSGARVRRAQQGLGRDGDSRGPVLRFDVGPVQAPRRHGAEGRSTAGRPIVERGRVALHGACAREEPGGRGLRARPDHGHAGGRPVEAGRRRAARGFEVVQQVRVLTDARQHGKYCGRGVGVCAISAVVRHGQYLLPHDRCADAGGSSGGGAQILRRQQPDRDDAVEGHAAGRHRHAAVAGQDRDSQGGSGRGEAGDRANRDRAGRRRRREDPADLAAVRAPAAVDQAALRCRVGARPRRQRRSGRADGRDDEPGRLEDRCRSIRSKPSCIRWRPGSTIRSTRS